MRIDVYYDLICPWCYIGFHRLRRALSMRPDLGPQIVWHPFQLNPSLPAQGAEQSDYLRTRYGSAARAQRIVEGITEIARRDGLDIDLDAIRNTPNSTKAHQLTLFHAAENGSVEPAIDALMRAHCSEGRNVGSDEDLIDIGQELGHSRPTLRQLLAANDQRSAVRARDSSARRLGIQAVPSLVIDNRFTISGAQEPNALLPLFDAASISGWIGTADDCATMTSVSIGTSTDIQTATQRAV